MVSKFFILFILLIILPDIYIDYHYFRKNTPIIKRLLWLVPMAVLLTYTCHMANQSDFIPLDYGNMEVFMLLLGLLAIPKLVFCICSALAWGHHRYHKTPHRRWEDYIGIVAAIGSALLFLYGFTIGCQQIKVNRLTIQSSQLPPNMDGYQIVHISDLHVGTYQGWRKKILQKAIDSINAQHPQLICFTGDLQNTRPIEINKVKDLIGSKAFSCPVVSILGNHDYGKYAGGTYKEKRRVEKDMIKMQEDILHWHLLRNSSYYPAPDKDSLFVVVGTENDGRPPFPTRCNYEKALQGIPDSAFIVMLQHDPSAWNRHILPNTKSQLTLSGHTHGGQISILGLRPTMIKYPQDYGLYEQDGRFLLVSGGLGGVVPFRLFLPAEINVITLRRSASH